MTPAEPREILSTVGWLSMQPEEIKAPLLAGSEIRVLPAGTMLYALDDPPGGLYGIADGFVDVMIAPGPFPPRLVHVGRAGWWVGEAAVATVTSRRAEVKARTKVTILHIPGPTIRRLADAKPQLWRRLASLTVQHLDTALSFSAALASSDLELRVLATLDRLAGPWSDPNAVVTLPLGQAELAELTGLSRNSVTRFLADLARRGCVERRYRSLSVNVANVKRLLESRS